MFLTVNVPPIIEVRDYVNIYGYGVTARFDFTDVPAKYHSRMLMMMPLKGFSIAQPTNNKPKPKLKPKSWWHKLFSKRTPI
jgi:hypothetical protein